MRGIDEPIKYNQKNLGYQKSFLWDKRVSTIWTERTKYSWTSFLIKLRILQGVVTERGLGGSYENRDLKKYRLDNQNFFRELVSVKSVVGNRPRAPDMAEDDFLGHFPTTDRLPKDLSRYSRTPKMF